MDYSPIVVALIVTIPPTFLGWLAWRTGTKNNAAINDIHISIDGRMDELLELTKTAAEAKGRVVGLKESKVKKSVS